MSEQALVYPMFAMVILSFAVLVTLFRTRLKSVRAAQVEVGYFETYSGPKEPDGSVKLSRHFVNLFETPVLFYAACLAGIATGLTGIAFHAMAWTYVLLRMAHAYIHTGANVLRWRIAAYFSSWFVLLAMWGYVSLHVAGGVG